MSEKEMPLSEALYVLCEAHTHDDEVVGYTVSECANNYFVGPARYVQAWGVVRRAIGQPFEPPLFAGHDYHLPFYDDRGNAYEACCKCRHSRNQIERENLPCPA